VLRCAPQVLSMPDHRSLLTRRAEALDKEADELELGSASVTAFLETRPHTASMRGADKRVQHPHRVHSKQAPEE
jgi:hypothetical protein